MKSQPLNWRRWWTRLLSGVGAGLFFPLLAEAGVPMLPPATATIPATRPDVHPVRFLTLPECIHLALENQPELAAWRASVAAAQDQQQALENLHLGALISHDMPIRRKQASLGVVIASAAESQAEFDTAYAVTRSYYSVLYARAQQKDIKSLIRQLNNTRQLAAGRLKAEQEANKGEKKNNQATKVYQSDIDQLDAYLALARNRQVEAVVGADRALAALREALGVGCDFCFDIPEETLPVLQLNLCCDQIVDLAVSRRGEIAQTVNAVQVTALEIDAQAALCLPVTKTFASAVDIHARPVPQGFHDGEYRPGAIALEYPPNLVGKRKDRMARASDFHARAEAVADKTRNLIVLEAKDSFLRWRQERQKIDQLRAAVLKATAAKGGTAERYRDIDPKVKPMLDALVLWVRARTDYNEAVYRSLLALADLQRVTAGGLNGWPECTLPPGP
jgi:outer membrane protein TolC